MSVIVGPRVITGAARAVPWQRGHSLAQFSCDDLFTIPAVCSIVGIARQTVYNTLWAHPEWFDPPHVQHGSGFVKKRYLTYKDVIRLTEQYPVIVVNK